MACPQGWSHRWVWIEDGEDERVEECTRCGEPRRTGLVDPEPATRLSEIRAKIWEGQREAGLVPMGGMNGRFPEDLR